MSTTAQFERPDDSNYDLQQAMNSFVLLHAMNRFMRIDNPNKATNVRIKQLSYRGGKPWTRMDVVYYGGDVRSTQSEVREFLMMYAPEDIGPFDATTFLTKVFLNNSDTYTLDLERKMK